MFGKPAAFGTAAPSTSFGFGQPASTANPFGQNQSLFGKPTTGFGSPSTSTFGQPAPSGLFTSQPQQTNLFQTNTSTFGAAPTTQSGFGSTGLFGQQPTSGGLFNSTSTFGQQNKPTGFGFGTNQQTPSLFGTQQTTNIFNPTGTTGLFGGSTGFGNQQTGTVIKFNPVTSTDTMMKNGSAQNINTKHHSITCMKEYENKSFEELRFEDYQANRKGPQQSTGFGGGTAFGGTPASTPSLFGQNDANKPAFANQSTTYVSNAGPFGSTTGGFGMTNQANTTASPFGKPTGFTAPTSSTGFGFGTNPAQNANPFGATPANKPFGTAAPQPLFGTGTSQPNTSGFGTGLFSNAQNTGTGLFSKPAQPTTGFGTAPSTGLLFNPPATTQSSLFSNTSKPLFGGGTTGTTPAFGTINTQPTQPSLFGNSFGKPTAPAFGTTQNPGFGTSLGALGTNQNSAFGTNTQPKPGGLFNTGTTGLFSNNSTPFQTNTFGIGQPQQQQQNWIAQPEQPNNNLALLTTDQFGDAPHLSGLEPKLKSNSATVSATDPKELKTLLDASKKVDMSHNSKLKVTPLRNARDSLFDTMPISTENTKSPLGDYQKTSCRRLILKTKGGGENTPGMNSTNILDVLSSEDKENRNLDTSGSGRANPLRLNFDNSVNNEHSLLVNNSIETQTFNVVNSTSKENFSENSIRDSPPPPSDDDEDIVNQGAGDTIKQHPTNIICTRPEYYTLPSLDDLVPDENGSCIVKGFTVGRRGYGNVYFPDEIDVANLNIDELIHFRYREINVYPDDSKKPPVGQGLNRKAQVTLDSVYPRRTGSNALIKDVAELMQMNFAEKLRKVTEKKNARFVDYRPETGSWVFKVDHFSKYGFNDSDEETDQNGVVVTKKIPPKPDGKQTEVLKISKPSEAMTKESLEEKEREDELVSREENEGTREPSSGFRLDKDILIDDDDQEVNDVLHHSMFVDDASEDDYRQIPSEVPMDLHFGSYGKNSSAKNIQVMKSTLFADDDRSSAGSHISIIKQYLDLPEMEEIPKLPTLQEEVPIRKRPLLRPKVFKVLNSYETLGSTPNVLPNRCCVDMGMFKGKSFKVGWSKGFNFYTLGNEEVESNSELAFNKIDGSPSFDPLKDVLTDSLKVVLEESTYQLNSSKIPTFKILKTDSYLKKQSAIFERLAAQYNSHQASYLHSIWTLCTALWGPSENTIANRRHLLTEWLKVTCNTDEITLKSGPYKTTSDAVDTIFIYLSIFKVFHAASLAMENRLPNLSLLIAQLSVPNVTKSFMQEQIEVWYSSLASNHISSEMKKLYLLLSGIPTKDEVNIFDSIDWKRAFGMHLWYICPNGAPIETAIEHYKKSFEGYSYAQRPNPPYMKDFSEEGAFDILYHILLLYKSGIHRLSSVLNPATHTDDPLDYRLSWLLLQLFLSLDVGLIEMSEKNKLCTSFSSQLEQLGHWEWAIFALLYLEDNSIKKNLIVGILDRNLDSDFDDDSQEIVDLLVNDMKIPPEWIHMVKAPKTLALEKYFEAFNHFALAEEYILANNVLVDHLLPSLFINEQFDVIRSLIEKLKPGSKDILHWNNEAGLVLEYLDLLEQSISSDNLIKIQMKLCSISDKIVNFPLNSDHQKVCVAELSKRCASLYKELNHKSQSHTYKDSYLQFIESLIMPPDFKQNEGLYLIHDFYNYRINNRQ